MSRPVDVQRPSVKLGTEEPWHQRTPWRRYLAACGFVLVLTVLQLTRQAGAPAVDTIWAEDGRVFLTDALADNSPLLLFKPLAGYLHLVPRLLAALAAVLPIGAAAVVFAVGPALIVSCLALYSYHAFRDLLPSSSVRLALATLVALLPAATTESANNAANLHFYLVFGAFAALIHQPRSMGGTVAGSTFAVIAAASDPRAALLLPLAVWSLARGSRRRRIIAVAFAVGILVQAIVLIAAFGFGIDPTTQLSAPRFQDSSLGHLPMLYAVRVVAHSVIGDRWIVAVWELLGPWLTAVGLTLLAVVATGIALHRSIRPIGFLILTLSVGYYTFQALAWGTEHLWPLSGGWAGNSRYIVMPQLLFILATAFLLDHLARVRGGVWRLALGLFVVAAFAVMAVHLRQEVIRSAGPRWSVELARARDRCQRPAQPVRIPITPPWDPDWSVRTDCERLNWLPVPSGIRQGRGIPHRLDVERMSGSKGPSPPTESHLG